MAKLSVINNRVGPNNRQLNILRDFLKEGEIETVIHGGDKQDIPIHELALSLNILVEIYPLVKSSVGDGGVWIKHEPLGLVDRNKTLIDKGDVIVGIPKYMNEDEDSPFWKTLRNAISQNKEIYCISNFGFLWALER